MSVQLRPHQVEAIKKLHNGCVLYGDVGVGKTITSLGYYFTEVCGGEVNKWGSMQTPRDVYVITTAKVRDSKGFELQAAQYGVHADPELSTNGVKITVDSWNNLHKYVGVEDAFFIFDEQRVVGYGAWSRAFIKIAKVNQWILLSATPGDTWMDYIPVFIANGWYKHKTDFIDQHVVWTPRVKYPKVLRYQNVGALVKRRNQVLVHMPYDKHTKRNAVDVLCEYDEELFEKAVKKRWHVYEKRPLRDVSELFSVMRRIVNSDESRLTAVSRLLTKHPKLIVFYNFDYELEALRSLGSEMTIPKTPSKRSDNTSRTPSAASVATKSKKTSTDSVLCPANCQGHWTVDRGSGEMYMTCTEYSKAMRRHTTEKSGAPQRSSSGTGTTSIPESGSVQTPSPSTASASSAKSSSETDSWDYLLSEAGQLANQEATCQKMNSLSSPSTSTTPSGDSSRLQTSSQFAVAEWNGHKHEEIPTTERWLYLVQYRAGAEGWNCVETDAICFYSQTYSYRDWFQAHGRIDRLNTLYTDLWYYHLISRSVIDRAIRAALRVKRNFNERDLNLQ